jgi:hypothetical protein
MHNQCAATGLAGEIWQLHPIRLLKMNPYKCFWWTILLLLLALQTTVVFAVEGSPAGANPDDVDFRWAFAAMAASDGKTTVQQVTQDISLKSGDQLKMMVELERRCFVYLFHFNSKDGLKLLFPYTLQQFESDYEVHRKYTIPRGDAWFKLDRNAGQEIFYLLASVKRLDGLEKTFLQYESTEPSSRTVAAQAVLDQIRSLRREHREITGPVERPVPIGGALRGVAPVEDPNRFDIATLADEILSSGFVARTYTVEHK